MFEYVWKLLREWILRVLIIRKGICNCVCSDHFAIYTNIKFCVVHLKLIGGKDVHGLMHRQEGMCGGVSGSGFLNRCCWEVGQGRCLTVHSRGESASKLIHVAIVLVQLWVVGSVLVQAGGLRRPHSVPSWHLALSCGPFPQDGSHCLFVSYPWKRHSVTCAVE